MGKRSPATIASLLEQAVPAGEIAGAVALVARPDAVDTYFAGYQDLAERKPMRRDTVFRILSITKPISAAALTDQIIPAQKAASPFAPGFWDENGLGFGGAVATRTGASGFPPGSYGWTGGFGTSFVLDPSRRLITILLTQRLMMAPDDIALAVKVQSLASSLEETR